MAKRPQDIAQRKLEHARKQVAAKTKAMKRLVTSIRMWERRAAAYAKQASLTDAEVLAAQEKRKAQQERRRQEKVRRGIQLQGVG